MANPKISVIIPAYNSEKTLEKCLRSVLYQDYDDYEVIVVDNNSSDNTKNIIISFGQKDKKIKYVSENQIGRGIARNSGIDNAKGEIILMTDSDCIVPENWIKELIKPIIYEGEEAVIGFEYDLIKNYWTKNIQLANKKLLERVFDGRYVKHIDTKNFAIKTSLMKKLMFDPNLGNLEDLDLYIRLRKISKIRFRSDIKVGHIHKNSFINIIKINFDRAHWTKIIFKKYGKNRELLKEPLFGGLDLKGFVLFPFWISYKFLSSNPRGAFYDLIAGLSWKLGLLF